MVPELGAHAGASRVGRVHVDPGPELVSDLGQRRHRIDGRGRRRADGGADVGGEQPRRHVGLHGGAQGVGAEGELVRPRRGDYPNVSRRDAGDLARLGESGMGLVGRVDYEPVGPVLVPGALENHLPGGDESAKHGLTGGGLQHATAAVGEEEALGEANELREPVEGEALELGDGGGGEPVEGHGVQRGGQQVATEGGGGQGGGEVGEEVGVGPVGHAGEHGGLDFAQHLGERHRLRRGRLGQEPAEVAGIHIRDHGVALDALVVLADEVDGIVGLSLEVVDVEWGEPSGGQDAVGVQASHNLLTSLGSEGRGGLGLEREARS